MVRKFILLLLFLLIICSLSLNYFFYKYISSQNVVVEVVDGDTFQLAGGKRVRLMGVDVPEYDRCGGKEAKNRLSELILDKKVTLKEEVKEGYGRTLALVYADNKFINEIMMREGWGRADYRKNSQREKLTKAFHLAQKEKLGIFSGLCREEGSPPFSECNIKGNIDKNTYEKFYHLPGCSQYDEVVIEKDLGEGYFCTEEEAVSAGFKRASGCP